MPVPGLFDPRLQPDALNQHGGEAEEGGRPGSDEQSSLLLSLLSRSIVKVH